MLDGTILRKRNGDERLLCGAYGLVDGECRVSTLAETNAYATLFVANDDSNAEGEAATAGHNASHAAYVESSLVEFAALARSTRTVTAAWATATATSAWAAALLARATGICCRLCRSVSILYRRNCDSFGIRSDGGGISHSKY
jgi:hypothetical protein